jgi:autotransporter-associated beta strand protein
MNPLSRRSHLLRAALLTATATVLSAPAGTLYWDTNGATAGSGNAGGTWDSGTNWTTDPTGASATTGWTNGESVVFSAGTDGLATLNITLGGAVSTPSILLEEIGLVNLSGGSIDVSGGSIFDTSVLGGIGGRSLTWSTALTGSGNLTLAAHGDTSAAGGGSNTIFTLSGANTFTGDVQVTSGVIGWTSNFGNAANTIVLNGGGLVFNTSGSFSRNLSAGAAGGTLRSYGSATTTHTGVLSGSGTFRRTDGGNFIVTQTATHTGDWDILRGTLTVGTGTETSSLLASSGTFTLGDAGAATTLRHRLDADVNWTSAVVFGNAGSVFAWQAGQANRVLTIANSTSFTNAAVGRFSIQNGEIRLASGADVKIAEISITNTNAANSRLLIESGAALTTRYFNIGDGSSTGGTVHQTGGNVTLESGGNGFRIGHWNNNANPGSTYHLSGGTLDATALSANAGSARLINIGWDGQGDMTVGGGPGSATLKAFGIQLDGNGNGGGSTGGNMTLTVANNGLVEVGAGGIGTGGAGDRIILTGGTLKATAATAWNSEINVAANSTLDANSFTATLGGNITGTADLNLSAAAGTVAFSTTGTQTVTANLTGNTAVNKLGAGTTLFSGTNTYSGATTVSAGTFNLTGSIANSALSLADGTTLRGEGSAASLTLGATTGANLFIDGNSAAAFTSTGTLAVNGITTVDFTSPLVTNGAVTVLHHGGTTATGADFALVNAASYRSALFNVTGSAVTLDVGRKDLVWAGTTANWELAGSDDDWNAAADNFYLMDGVTFNDSNATNNAITLVGSLSSGDITVNSNTNNFTFTGSAGNVIAGGSSLLKAGSSTLAINAPNTFTGGTVLSQGQIHARSNAALGTGSIVLGDSNTGSANIALYLDSNRTTIGNAITVSNNGTGTATLGSRSTISGSGDNNQFTNITLQRDVIFDSNAGDRTDYENIKGTGNITVTGAGRTIFITTNTFTGDVTVNPSGNGGNLQLGAATAVLTNYIPDSSNLIVQNFATASQAEFRLSSQGETVNGLSGDGTIDVNSINGTLTVGSAGGGGNFSGVMQNGGASVFSFAKIGAGTQILSGNNGYSGTTAINGGTLQVGNGGASGDLGTGTVTLAAGTTLTYQRTGAVTQEGQLNSATTGAGILNINGDATTAVTLAGANAGFSGTVNLNQGTLVFGATNPTGTGTSSASFNLAAGTTLTNTGSSVHGHIGNITMSGGSTWTTGSGTGSYNSENYQLNGTVTVTGGTTAALITRESSRTNANSGIALRGTRTFDVADVTGNTAADLIISTELEASDNDTGVNQGALIKTGTGTLALNAVNSYTGTTTVTAGTLLVNGSIGAGAVGVGINGTLGGGSSTAGLIGGNVTVDGTLAPGSSPGTLALAGDLTFNSTASLLWEIDPTAPLTLGLGVNDLVTVGGDLTLDGILHVTGTGSFSGVANGSSWTLITYSGTLTDNLLTLGTLPTLDVGSSWSLDTGTAGQVNLTVIPEPRAALLGGLGLLLILRRRRC